MNDATTPAAVTPKSTQEPRGWLRRLGQVATFRLFGVVLMMVVLYALLRALSPPGINWVGTHETLAARLGFLGVLTVGVGILIVAGGIDLSIGSVVGLIAVLFALLVQTGLPPLVGPLSPVAAAGAVLAVGALIGLGHGLCTASLRLQPFIVTLCGWFIYRGLARWAAGDRSVSLSERVAPETAEQIRSMRWLLYSGSLRDDLKSLLGWDLLSYLPPDLASMLTLPHPLVLLILLTIILWLFMHRTRHGRYLFALGANEEAAKYAGIGTGGYKVLAYVLCSVFAALGGLLFVLDKEGAQPDSAGGLMELYAITGAVLGGCSLRGGEGSVLGMFLGAAVLPLLFLFCRYVLNNDALEYVVVGGALLLGTITDETLRRLMAWRKK